MTSPFDEPDLETPPWPPEGLKESGDKPAANSTPDPGSDQNRVSVNFNSAPGYDRIGVSVTGTPQYIANLFAIGDFDGKISTLMRRAVEVDQFFKVKHAEANKSGKA